MAPGNMTPLEHLNSQIAACSDPRLIAIREEMARACDERAAATGNGSRPRKAAAQARFHEAGARHRVLLVEIVASLYRN